MSDKDIRIMIAEADALPDDVKEALIKIAEHAPIDSPLGAKVTLMKSVEKVTNAMCLCTVVAYDKLEIYNMVLTKIIKDTGPKAIERINKWDFSDDEACQIIKDMMFMVRDDTEKYLKEIADSGDNDEQ